MPNRDFAHNDEMAALARALSSFLILASGCGTIAPATNNKPLYPGDPHGQASLESLPELDVADSEITSEMRMAQLLTAESLSVPDPARPAATSAEAIQLWSDQVLKGWLEEKHKRAEAARLELDRAAVQNHRQRIMAGAMVGLVYEDVARVLMSVPVPEDLKQEPEIAQMFSDVVAHQAFPYLTQSRRAYEACAQNAIDPKTMNHWTGFCQGRADQLPGGKAAPKGGSSTSTTEVTVVKR